MNDFFSRVVMKRLFHVDIRESTRRKCRPCVARFLRTACALCASIIMQSGNCVKYSFVHNANIFLSISVRQKLGDFSRIFSGSFPRKRVKNTKNAFYSATRLTVAT